MREIKIIKIIKIIENGIEYEVRESSNGNKFWYLNGLCHRESGPAVEANNEYEAWYKYGKRHRENYPARIWQDGRREYWLNGIYYPYVNSPEELLLASIIT